MSENFLKTCPICGSRTEKIDGLFVCQSEKYPCGEGWKISNNKIYSPTIYSQKSREAAKECLEFIYAVMGSRKGATC